MSRRARPEDNPLREGLRVGGASEPALFTIFGATGDLAQRKLLPAIYNLAKRGLLPPRFGVIGYARTDMGDDGLSPLRQGRHRGPLAHAPSTSASGRRSPRCCTTTRGGFDDPSHFHALARTIEGPGRADRRRRPPRVLPVHAVQLLPRDREGPRRGQAARRPHLVRVVIEKPFGHDLQSARSAGRDRAPRRSTSSRSTGSTTTWARRPSRTSTPSGSPTRIFEPIWSELLRRPRADHGGRVARRRAPRPPSTRRPASSATSSRTTCCR